MRFLNYIQHQVLYKHLLDQIGIKEFQEITSNSIVQIFNLTRPEGRKETRYSVPLQIFQRVLVSSVHSQNQQSDSPLPG